MILPVITPADTERNKRLINHNINELVKDYNAGKSVFNFTDQDATPSVVLGKTFKTTNTAPTTIIDFTNGHEGQQITVIINDANTIIDFTASSLKGNVGVDWSPTTGDHMNCVYDGTDWYCNISDNTA